MGLLTKDLVITYHIRAPYSEEVFNDALFYLEQAENLIKKEKTLYLPDEFYFSKQRFYRSSIIDFCSSADAWVNAFLIENMQKNRASLDSEKENFLNFLIDEAVSYRDLINKKASTVPFKLSDGLYWATGVKFISDKNYKKLFKKYIELSNLRNSLVHYSTRYKNAVYKQDKVSRLAKEAPDIISNLINFICKKLNIPQLEYLQKRKSHYSDKISYIARKKK